MDNSTATSYGVVLVTASSESEGKAIAQALVEAHLAACVSLAPIQSIYTWQGKLHSEPEWQLVIKTDLALFSNLEKKIRELQLHSYEVSEIIALPIFVGSQPYLEWIAENVQGVTDEG